MTTRNRRFRWRLAAALLVLGVVAASCGGDDDAGPGEAVTDGDPDEGASPARGGRLVYAREAETSSPWTPSQMLCDTSCHQVVRGFYDPLTFVGEDEQPHPYLLESFEPNETYDEWTFTAREGVTFHDDTPFDGAALLDHFERMSESVLVGNALQAITGVEQVDDMSVRITTETPWVNLPIYFSAQPGYVASPTWLAAVDEGTADETEAVGTGPFELAEYNPGSSLRLVRSEDYWLEAPDGEPYPYLDEIEFIVQEEDATRARAVQSGEIDITHTDRGSDISNLRDLEAGGSLNLFEMGERSATTYALINVSEEDSPLADVEVRRAAAMAVDQEFRNASREDGVFDLANGPFPPGTPGHLEDTGFPGHDPDGARAIIEEYEAEHGPIEISFRTTADADNLRTVELMQQDLAEAGIDVRIDQTEQGEFIQQAVLGNFEVFTWRAHGGIDPETERVWWHSENSGPAGSVALNFGRFEDEVIDENLQIMRETSDEDERRAAAEAVNRRFGEQVYNIWGDWKFWVIAHQPSVRGVQTALVLPDGTPGLTQGLGGVVGLAQLWVDG